MGKIEELLKRNNIKEPTEKNEPIKRISREEFDLLDVTYSETIYYITEIDGSITIKEGEY